MHEVYKHIGRVSKQDVTVLITGESGTGKELVARSIYQHSLRAKRPFLAINCAAIPEALLESELFGHEQGAFTGAAYCRIGKFEQCNGGTLFLDEVGDMTPVTQAKILRVLQEQQFERVGGNKTIQTDVRILAATNRNLPERVKNGQYREDLYYRLNVYSITVPPLRERGDDVALLVEILLKRFARAMGVTVTSVAPEAMQLLSRYPWPGNVRELQSIVKYAIVQATSGVIVPESDGGNWETVIQALMAEAPADLYKAWLARTDTILFNHILKFTNGNLVHASKILGMNRGTLRGKIRSLNISTESFRDQDAELDEPPQADLG
jgi:two-component system nitrogen regulation response regulator GlnG